MTGAEITLVKYRAGMPLIGGRCHLCRSAPAIGNDHCHEHDWIRGPLCNRCNLLIGRVEAGKPVRTEITDSEICGYRNRCPECLADAVSRELKPRTVGVSVTPEARHALRTLAGLAAGVTEQPVSMSDALVAAVPVIREHPDEYRAALETEPV